LSGRTVTHCVYDIIFFFGSTCGSAPSIKIDNLVRLRDLRFRLPNGNSEPLAAVANFS